MMMMLLLFYTRNQPFKFGQNWVSNSLDISVVVFFAVVFVAVVDDDDVVVVDVLSLKPTVKAWSKFGQ